MTSTIQHMHKPLEKASEQTFIFKMHARHFCEENEKHTRKNI